MVASRLISALATASLAFGPSLVFSQISHLERDLGSTPGPISNAALDGRIREAAAQFRAYAPVPRIAMYDIAYPHDCAELGEMKGYAVILISAVVQDSSELPVTQAYVRSPRGDVQLSLVARVRSRVASADTVVKKTFGAFRADALYLLPVELRRTESDLLLDFATHRLGFRVGHLAAEFPEKFALCGGIAAEAKAPADAVVWELVQREYPDLSRTFSPGH